MRSNIDIFSRSPRYALSTALLVVFAASLWSSPVRAQVGGASAIFLMIEPDSRSAGMGNTGVGIADNANAIFWNPAGLAYQRGAEVGITHSRWLPELDAGLFYEYLVGKYHYEGIGTFGGHVTYLNLGEHEHRNSQNELLGTFRSYDVSAGISYGKELGDHFAIGTGARFIYSKLAEGTINGNQTHPGISVGVDLAGLYRSPELQLGGTNTTISAGFNLANMGPKIDYVDDDSLGGADPIPTNLRFGYSVKFNFDEYNELTISNDFSKMLTDSDTTTNSAKPWYQAVFTSWKPIMVDLNPNDDEPGQRLGVLDQLIVGMGAEYWYNQLFALRGGYFYEHPYNGNREFLTFGAGLRYNIVGVDFSYIYALEEDHPLSNTMRFSLLLDFAQ